MKNNDFTTIFYLPFRYLAVLSSTQTPPLNSSSYDYGAKYLKISVSIITKNAL
jgi:hypothetical protein